MSQACRACKQGKRRCDKAFPRCNLCQRTGRECDYSERQDLPPTATEIAMMRARLDDLEKRIAVPSEDIVGGHSTLPNTVPHHESIDVVETHTAQGTSSTSACEPDGQATSLRRFPAALFLDIDCFVMARMQLLRPSACVPMEALALLTEGNAVMDIVDVYFSTVHSWLPILSKKRMDLGIPAQGAGPDLAMLLLAMKLVVSLPDQARSNNLYCLVKDFSANLERHGIASLLYLQALILISVYEYGHGLYPAAWMTIGACARYAHVLGLSCARKDELWISQATTWTEVEERRRAWWAIFILDRLVSMGSRRPFCLPGLLPEAKLPAADEAWDSGNAARAIGNGISTPYQTPQGPFARLCQAAIYVDRSMACVPSIYSISDSSIVELSNLVEEIQGFCAALDCGYRMPGHPDFPLLLSTQSVAYSAMFLVLDSLTCPEKLNTGAGYATSADAKSPAELDLQVKANLVIQKICNQVRDLCSGLMEPMKHKSDELLAVTSPFMLHVVYSTIATFYWYTSESGSSVYRANAEELNEFMQAASRRWEVASKYIELARLWDISRKST